MYNQIFQVFNFHQLKHLSGEIKLTLISTIAITLIFIGHFFGDFLFQGEYIARRKHKSYFILIAHQTIYATCILVALVPLVLTEHIELTNLFLFVIVNHLAHGMVDFWSSRFSKKYFDLYDFRKFFITLGIDQLIHKCTLIVSYFIFLS